MTTIRPATPADLDPIVRVFRACWTRSYAAFAAPEDLARLDEAASVELWRGALGRPGTTLVALQDGEVAGLTRFDQRDDVVQVHSLYVHPDAQGGGLGGRLLDAALGDAPRGQLWVFSANRQGRGFYAKHGWRPDGSTRTQPQFGMPETRLVREPYPTLADVARRLTGADMVLEAGEAPPVGAVVGVTGQGVVAVGSRNRAGDPMTAETWFDLASVTKLVTTVAMVQLVSCGRVDLDAAAGGYWAPAGDLVVRDLLGHRAGLLPWQPLYAGRSSLDRDETLRLALALPRDPAGTYRYSDLGFVVLGEVVAAVVGQSLPEAVRTLVCDPLGVDLRYGADLGADATVAAGSRGDEVERTMVATGEPYPVLGDPSFAGWRSYEVAGEANDGNCFHALGGVSGHAGLFATVPALLRLGEHVASPTVLDAATVSEFCLEGPHSGQALGFRTRTLDSALPTGELSSHLLRNSRHRSEDRLLYHPGFTGCALAFVPGGAAYAVGTNRLLAEGKPVPADRLLATVVALTQRPQGQESR